MKMTLSMQGNVQNYKLFYFPEHLNIDYVLITSYLLQGC